MFSEETNKNLAKQRQIKDQLNAKCEHGFDCSGMQILNCQGDCEKHFTFLQENGCNNCWRTSSEARELWAEVEKDLKKFQLEHGHCQKGVDSKKAILDHFAEVFQGQGIESVVLNNGELTINRSNGKPSKTFKKGEQLSEEMEELKLYLEINNKNQLLLSEVRHSTLFNPSKPTNYRLWIIGSITILAILAGIYLYLRKNNKESSE